MPKLTVSWSSKIYQNTFGTQFWKSMFCKALNPKLNNRTNMAQQRTCLGRPSNKKSVWAIKKQQKISFSEGFGFGTFEDLRVKYGGGSIILRMLTNILFLSAILCSFLTYYYSISIPFPVCNMTTRWKVQEHWIFMQATVNALFDMIVENEIMRY